MQLAAAIPSAAKEILGEHIEEEVYDEEEDEPVAPASHSDISNILEDVMSLGYHIGEY